jgi:phage-related protein
MPAGVVRQLFTAWGFKIQDGKLVRMNKLVGQAKGELNRATSAASSFGNSVRNAAAAFLGFSAAKAGLGAILDANVTLQSLKASLFSIEGGADAADRAFEKISAFATKTPFELTEVAQSFIKLKNLGLDPSEKALNSYGNTASAMGKSLDQLIEAVADAATGEFERLKEFGIKTKKEGENVTFTFRGIKTTVQNEAGAIQGFLQGLGDQEFGGAMALQMDTLGGRISNLKDAFFRFLTAIGEAGANDVFDRIAQSMIGAAGQSDGLAKTIGQAMVAAAELALVAWEKLIAAFQFAREHSDELKIAIGALLAALVVQQVVSFAASIGTVLVSAMTKAGAAAAAAGASLTSFAGALAAVKAAMLAFVGGPAVLGVAAIAVAVIAGTLALIDLFRALNSGQGIIGGFINKFAESGGILGALADSIKGIIEEFRPAFDSFKKGVVSIFDTVKSVVSGVIGSIVGIAKAVLPPIIRVIGFVAKIVAKVIGLFFSGFGEVFNVAAKVFKGIGLIVRAAFGLIRGVFEGAVDFISTALEFWVPIFKLTWDSIDKNFVTPMRNAFAAVAGFLGKVFDPVATQIKKAFDSATETIKDVIRALPTFLRESLPDELQAFAGLKVQSDVSGKRFGSATQNIKAQTAENDRRRAIEKEAKDQGIAQLEALGLVKDGKVTVSQAALTRQLGAGRTSEIVAQLGEVNITFANTPNISADEIASSVRQGVNQGAIDLGEAARDAGATR